jgi:hypothetical protein
MHPIAGEIVFDGIRRLAVFPSSSPSRAVSHLVSARHALARGNACDSSASGNLIDRDNDIVFR